MISSIAWIPRGVADPNPKKYKLSKAESELLEQIQNENHSSTPHDDDDSSNESPVRMDQQDSIQKLIQALPVVDPSTLPAELRMDEYSDDENDSQEQRIGQVLLGSVEAQSNYDDIQHLIEVPNDDDDDDDDDDSLGDVPDTREYIPTDIKGLEAMKFSGYNGMSDYRDNMDEDTDYDEDDESDLEDTNLRPEDALIIVAKTEEDFASLEVHVYEESSGNLFVHHDIPLPSYPLCLAHGTINSEGQAGNYVAVGSFHPGIEIWNLDVLEVLEPECILGGEDTSYLDDHWKNIALGNKVKKGKDTLSKASCTKKGPTLRRGSHKDAVMSLAWNAIHRQVLASGSADKTVKLWDITQQSGECGGIDGGRTSSKFHGPSTTWTHHTDKVQSLAWHPNEGTILASGSYDRSVCILDARVQDGSVCKRAKIPADCEAIAWDPHQPHLLTAASEDGTLTCWDVRNFGKNHYWSFVAHEFGGCSDISYNSLVPGMLATCAIDKTVAIWDTMNLGTEKKGKTRPSSCGSKDMCVGKLYTVSFYSDSPWLLGCGGSGNELALWDLSSDSNFVNRFSSRIQGSLPVTPTTETKDTERSVQEDLKAMMVHEDAIVTKPRDDDENMKKKKKDTVGKKKVVKKGR